MTATAERTAAERAAARRQETLGDLDLFPNSLLVPLLRAIYPKLDIALNSITVAEQMERIAETCRSLPGGNGNERANHWETWSWSDRPGRGPVQVGYIFEQEGKKSILIKVVGLKDGGNAVRVVYELYDPASDKYYLTPERGWWSAKDGFDGAGDDEALDVTSLLGVFVKDARSARKSFEKLARKKKAHAGHS